MALNYTAYTKLMEDYQLPGESSHPQALQLSSAAAELSGALDANREPFILISHQDGTMGSFRMDKSGCTDFTYHRLDMTGRYPQVVKAHSGALVLFAI